MALYSSSIEARLLLDLIRTPWSAAPWLAAQCDISIPDVETALATLQSKHLAQSTAQTLKRRSQQRYAPTEEGLIEVGLSLNLSPATLAKWLHYNSSRSQALHLAQDISQDAATILAATQRDSRARASILRCDAEIFSPRRYQNRDLFLHGQFVLHSIEKGVNKLRPYILHIDRGDSNVWQWWKHLRYLAGWAKRLAAALSPTLLIVSTRAFRVLPMLRLAQMAGTVPAMSVAATASCEMALSEGLLAVARCKDGWRTLLPNQTLQSIDPFIALGVDHEIYTRSAFAVRTVESLLTESAKIGRSSPKAAKTLPLAAKPSPHAVTFEALGDDAQLLLNGLCRYPVATSSILASLFNLPMDNVLACLDQLAQAQCAEIVPSKIDEMAWAASDIGAQLRLAREMQPDSALKRYRFFRADHSRRVVHTLTCYRFFTGLRDYCQRRSRAMRKLDTRPGAINDGHIPYYELSVIESELMASDWFARDGHMHYWRPDGYGALRAGLRWTRFWLEIDGTANAPSRKDPQIWLGKMARLCDYLQSGRWQLRYPVQPCTLIVTTDLRNRGLIFDALTEAARARSMPMPQVWLATAAAVQQRGALAKIWFDIRRGNDVMAYAFKNVAPVAVGIYKRITERQMTEDADQNGWKVQI